MPLTTGTPDHLSLAGINMFPVKGLNPVRLLSVELEPGAGIGDDRRMAIVNGISKGGDPDKGVWVPCRTFFINTVNDGLPLLQLLFDANEGYALEREGKRLRIGHVGSANLEQVNRDLPAFLKGLLEAENGEPPRLVLRAPDHHGSGYWDYDDTPVSILNPASISALSAKLGKPLDPDRFRGNLLLEGLEPWQEFELIGERLSIGDAEIEITRPINRCEALSVNPETGERDASPATILASQFGHVFCGLYGRVTKPGTIFEGDEIKRVGASASPWNQGLNPNAPPYQQWPRHMIISGYEQFPDHTKLTLSRASHMPLPEASAGQKFRFHLPHVEGHDRDWTADFAVTADDETLGFVIEPSATSDPKTEYLRTGLSIGHKLLVSGPYGRMG